MSHTTIRSTKTDIEHITFAQERYSAMLEAIEKDIATSVTNEGKLVLLGLREHAESGMRLAEQGKTLLLNSFASQSGSH